MKNVFFTISIGRDYQQIAQLTHPFMKQYAEKIGAEFINITGPAERPHWQKFLIGQLLDRYDRVLYMDTDIYVKPHTPDLFGIVPFHEIGMFEEGKYEDRYPAMMNIGLRYPEHLAAVGNWNGLYYNTGVMVVSGMHRELFLHPNTAISDCFFEQSYINLMISEKNTPMLDIGFRFNHMSLMDRFIYDRSLSYIIHYAGWHQRGGINNLIDQIRRDIAGASCIGEKTPDLNS